MKILEHQDTKTSSAPSRVQSTWYDCGKPGHLATTCSDSKSNGVAVNKKVIICMQDCRLLCRGTLRTSSGEQVSFLFHSGSFCSLL